MGFCLDCDKQLSTRTKNKKTQYCVRCFQKHREPFPLNKELSCVVCNTLFKSRTRLKKICSTECRRKRNLSHQRKRYRNGDITLNPDSDNVVTVNCTFCGKEKLLTKRRRSKSVNTFCSQEHFHKYLDQNKQELIEIKCKICQCVIRVTQSNQKHRPRKTCSKECLKKWKRKKAEERRIKEGYTKHQLDKLARYSPEAREWREAVFERDDYTCQFCNLRGGRLEADHIKPWAYYPDHRFDIGNGRTLCRPCHDTTKHNSKTMKEMFLNGYWDE